MKIDEREKIMKSLQGVSGITDVLRNSAVNTAFFRPGKSKAGTEGQDYCPFCVCPAWE